MKKASNTLITTVRPFWSPFEDNKLQCYLFDSCIKDQESHAKKIKNKSIDNSRIEEQYCFCEDSKVDVWNQKLNDNQQ